MLGELVRESLYDTVLLSGLAHVIEVLEEERTEVCGPRYRHTEERTAQRGGRVPSSLVLGGRLVNVKRWKSGRMILRWSAAGALEAERGFRRLKGYRQMTKLVVALQSHDATIDGTVEERAAAA